MPFQIIRNDITKVKADAIVNTANPNPVIGSGTDYAIHKAAGPELLEARKKIGAIAIGSAVQTPAFNLPAKYVFHTVGPTWEGGVNHELELLRKAYDAALALAGELRCKSIAFPLMAAGSYGFPHDQALRVAISAFTDYLLSREMKIFLVILNGDAFHLAGALFDDLKSYIDDNYVESIAAEEYSHDGRRQRRELESLVSGSPRLIPLIQNAIEYSIDDYIKREESGFRDKLLSYLNERTGKDSEVYKRAQISKQLFSKILNNKNYRPTKSTVIQLAIGLELDLENTQKLLNSAGYSLTNSDKSDLVIQYFIERKEYNVVMINIALAERNYNTLSTGLCTKKSTGG